MEENFCKHVHVAAKKHLGVAYTEWKISEAIEIMESLYIMKIHVIAHTIKKKTGVEIRPRVRARVRGGRKNRKVIQTVGYGEPMFQQILVRLFGSPLKVKAMVEDLHQNEKYAPFVEKEQNLQKEILAYMESDKFREDFKKTISQVSAKKIGEAMGSLRENVKTLLAFSTSEQDILDIIRDVQVQRVIDN